MMAVTLGLRVTYYCIEVDGAVKVRPMTDLIFGVGSRRVDDLNASKLRALGGCPSWLLDRLNLLTFGLGYIRG